MGKRAAWSAVLVVLALTLGVGSAGGRMLDTTTTSVTVEVIGKGRVTSSSPAGIECGDGATKCHLTFTSSAAQIRFNPIETASGWHFASWDGCNDLPGTNTCFSGANPIIVTAHFEGPPAPTRTLSVAYAGTGTVSARTGGTTQVDCGSGSASTDCSWSVVDGSTLTVLETPGDGYVFSGWGGACGGTSVACTVEMNGDQAVNAAFTVARTATSTLTVSISGSGTVVGGGLDCTGPATCAHEEPIDSTVTLTATPEEGYVFTGWTAGTTSSCSGTGTTCTLTMDTDRTVTATFTLAVPLAVSVNGSGNVSGGAGAINCGSGGTVCSATFAQNATVTLLATPATGATFAGWTGACGGTATTCTVLMSAARSVTATFTGGTSPGTTSATLSVSVTGNGTVTGGGINCGSGATTCSANQTANAIVTLTATPAAGATFSGWGGACAGTVATCTVTMTTAKSVSATFAGGASPTVQLAVTVTGKGSVKGGAISCGNGLTGCSASLAPGTSVTLTETPAKGAAFSGWGGACAASAKKTTCTVTVSATTSVTAAFTGGAAPPSAGLTALARPLVEPSKTGFSVTLRFRTSQAGTARVRGLRAGRAVVSLSVRVPAGAATIGPFQVETPGFYTFEVRLGSHTLRWRACLGRCGADATAPAFVLTRQTPVVTHAGAVWSVTLRFAASAISDAHIRVYRGGKFLADHHFLARAREIVVGPFLLGPGSYTLRLHAVDAYGRVKTLTWVVDLAR